MSVRGKIYGVMALAVMSLTSAAANAKAPEAQQLKINIVAKIADRCGISASGPRTNDEVRLDQSQTVTFGFTLDCNTPFRIGVATRNGGLRLLSAANDGRLTDQQGFGVQKPYTVGLSFMTDQMGLVDAGRCASDQLTAMAARCAYFGNQPGDGFSPGNKTTAVRQDGKLEIRWSAEDGTQARLAAGKYEDILTVVVGPRT